MRLFKNLMGGALILVAGAVLAADLPIKKDESYVAPDNVPGATTVDSAKAYELWQAKAWFIDPRKTSQFEEGHIPGAINLEYAPSKSDNPLTAAALEAKVPKGDAVVFYCNAEKCDRSSWGAALAAEWGWSKVYYYRDGYPAWVKAGYPVQ